LFSTTGRIRNPAYGGIGNDAFNLFTRGKSEVFFDEEGGSPGHIHGLVFKGFPYPRFATIDDRSYSDPRQSSN
jgi:hypothetical protein